MAVKTGIDAKRLDEAGWGIILADDADPGIVEALGPLLRLRQEQAGDRFRLFHQDGGYRSGKDTKSMFLARNGVGPGPADPDRVPYYLLLVGSFQEIPYRFQIQMDVQYAVGRLCFDSLEEYALYAETVVAAETEPPRTQPGAVVFGVAHPDDPHTATSVHGFAQPLAYSLARRYPDLRVESITGPEASKAHLLKLLHRDVPPALLVTSGHGMVFPPDDPRAAAHQGALLCADWPGPLAWQEPIPPEFYFSGDDVMEAMHLRGLISLHYSSFSAGTVLQDPRRASKKGGLLSGGEGTDQVARLAQRLLAHPQGGALAVVGLVDRAWSYAWPREKSPAQTQVLTSVLMRLLDGFPVGSALEYTNERYAELSTVLSDELDEITFGKRYDPLELAQTWTANNDARSLAIVGDPAVRLAGSQALR